MQATHRTRHADHPNFVPLSSPVNTDTIGEIYDAVRYKPGDAIVRAGKDPSDHWYVYLPKKEHKLAATTYKASSIRRHRQQMQELLLESTYTFDNKDWVGLEQRKMIMMLLHQVMKKDIRQTDFSAREVAATLKPLSNQTRSRKRLKKTSALKATTSPILKSRKDYLKQFLSMNDSDLRIMNQALFPADKTIFFKEQKLILQSIFSLIRDYLKSDNSGQTLAELVRRSPQKDLLLKFAKAWTDHVKKPHSGRYGNLLVVFSWQKTMTSICQTIIDTATPSSASTAEFASPERSKVLGAMMRRSHVAMDGEEPESPTKFPSLQSTPIASAVAIPIVVDSPSSQAVSLQTLGKFKLAENSHQETLNFALRPEVTAQLTSVALLPEIGDADSADIVGVDSQAMHRTEKPQV